MSNKAFAICLTLLLLALSTAVTVSLRPVPVVVQTNLERLPMEISGYTATEDTFSEEIYRELNADKNIYRHYRSKNGDQIDVYIGYYGTAKGGRTGHHPYACLPGEGAAIVDMGTVHIKDDSTNAIWPINYVHARKDGINTLMLHWYQTAGSKVVSNGLRQNVERFFGRVLHNRNDGAFVRLTSQVNDIEVADKTAELKSFAVKVIQLLPSRWPVEH